MDFLKFQNNWRKAGEEMNPSACQTPEHRRKTSLDRLAARYRNFSISSIIAAFWSIFLYWIGNAHSTLDFPSWLLLSLEIYFLIASVMDYWLYNGIRSIDCSAMTVEAVLHKSLFYRKRHMQFMVVLIPLALAIVTAMAIHWKADMGVVYGMLAGFLFGIAMGTRFFLNFMRDYRQIAD